MRLRASSLGRGAAVTALVLGSLAGVATTAGAAGSFTVDDTGTATDANPGDGVCATAGSVCTLTAALVEASATGGAVTIAVPAGTHRIGAGRTVTADVTIVGAGRDATTIDLDGERGFTFDRVDATLRDLRITGARTDGDAAGVAGVSANVTLQRIAADDNIASDGSGGFLRANAGTVTVTDSVFTDNQAYDGGALAVTNSKLTVTGSTFAQNAAAGSGGAIWADHPIDLSIVDSTFTDNVAVDQGGAVFLDGVSGDAPTPKITGSTFTGNHAANEGGALFVASTGGSGSGVVTLVVSGSTFTGNVGIVGGGIASDQGRIQVSGSAFVNNEATDGAGGGIASGGALAVADSTFEGNSASTYGGGIAANGPATIDGSTFTGNSAGTQGGGVALVGDQTPSVTNSTFTDNTADVDAGGIWRLGDALDQSGVSFSGNTPNDVIVEPATVAEETSDGPDGPDGPPADRPGDTPGTGDAPGGGDGADTDGAGPGTTQVDLSGERPGGSGHQGLLATTGAKITLTVFIALALIAAGVAARLLAARRRA